MSLRRAIRRFSFAMAALGLAGPALAQCATALRFPTGLDGVDGSVSCCIEWDPDGSGPATPQFVFGGTFYAAGPIQVQHLTAFDPATGLWSSFGGGIPGASAPLTTLAAAPNGDLYVGGSMTVTSGAPSNYIARWNGTTWQALGTGLDAPPQDLLALPNGTLVAAGSFTNAGGVNVPGIAQWNGTAWAPLGAGLPGVSVATCLALRPNGNVVAGGGQGGVHGVAEWNGSTWQALGSGVTTPVRDVAVMANGNVVVTTGQVLQWNGSVWSAFSPGLQGTVNHVVALANGDLVAAGRNNLLSTCAIWNGTAWSFPPVRPYFGLSCVAAATPGFLLGSEFPNGGESGTHWDGTRFLRVGSAPDGFVHALAVMPNGDVVAGGSFVRCGHIVVNGIARWDGQRWFALGSGTNAAVGAIAVMPNGDVVAGGTFTTAGGSPANGIARWNGASWSRMDQDSVGGFLPPSQVGPLAFDRNGALLAGMNSGSFGSLRRWNGSGWSTITSGAPSSIVQLPDGDQVVGYRTGGAVRWDGTTFTALATPFPVSSMAVTDDGTLYAAPATASITVQRWTGSNWFAVGAALPFASWDATLTALPDGDLLVSYYDALLDAPQMARWELPAATGITTSGNLMAAMRHPDGSIYLGGQWNGGYFARLVSTCPANVLAFGNSCNGSAGPVTLDATRAWIGGTCRLTASGFGPGAIALSLQGAPQPPQAVPLPFVPSGCTLATTLVEIGIHLPSNGRVEEAVAVPNVPALIGLTVARQIAAVEFDALGNITLAATSNALALTVGAF